MAASEPTRGRPCVSERRSWGALEGESRWTKAAGDDEVESDERKEVEEEEVEEEEGEEEEGEEEEGEGEGAYCSTASSALRA